MGVTKPLANELPHDRCRYVSLIVHSSWHCFDQLLAFGFSTVDEYAALVKKIRDTAPDVAEGSKVKLSKPQQAHVELLPALEARRDAVDAYVKVRIFAPQLDVSFHSP